MTASRPAAALALTLAASLAAAFLLLPSPPAAAAQEDPPAPTDQTPAEGPDESLSEQTIEVAPQTGDEAIAERLGRILERLEAVGWVTGPSVRVEEGIVTLRGTADTADRRRLIGDLARSVRDVAVVINAMEVAPPDPLDLTRITATLRAWLTDAVEAVPYLLFALVVLALTFFAAGLARRLARRFFGPRIENPLLETVAVRAVAVLVAVVGVYLVLSVCGLTGLAAGVLGGAGLGGLVIGFAFRNIAENFLASVLLSMSQPFRAGDVVEIAGELGVVQKVTTRGTWLMSLDGNHIQIPNGTVYTSVIRNLTANPNVRLDFLVGVDYEDGVAAAQGVILEALRSHPAVLADPEPLVLLDELGASTVNLRVYFWCDVRQGLVADLLDKGTAARDRFEIAEALEGRGARLGFYSDGLRLGFAGRALRADLPAVLALAAEQLRTPAFDPDEVAKAVTKAVASVRRSLDSTGARASGAMRRRLYTVAHPNYALGPADEIASLDATAAADLRAYHAAHVAPGDLTVAVVGDLDPDATRDAVAEAFGDWAGAPPAAVFATEAAPDAPGRETIEMQDRPNLDVRLGHAVGIRRDADDFLSLYAAVFALGGNFSGHLMQTIRDEQGLTYGIGAGIVDPDVRHDAHVQVSVTLSAPDLERGLAATRAEIERFVASGLGEADLERTRTTLAGQHVVGLATTGGLAARLLVNAERGFGTAYLDRYPDLVRGLRLSDVNAALRRYVRPDALHVVAAGTPAEAA